MSAALPAGRAILPLLPAARLAVAEWAAYTGTGGRGGHDDAQRMAAAMGRLRDALAEAGAPGHRIELYPPAGTTGTLAQRIARAVTRARAGAETTVITYGGYRAALLIPAARAQGAITAGLVRELAEAVTGGRTHAVISRDKGGNFRVEPATTAQAARRDIMTDATVLDAWSAGEPVTDEGCAEFAAATTAELRERGLLP